MDELFHYGTERHSGRYPYGSGENPYQHDRDFLAQYREYHAQGYSDVDIARMMGISTTTLRNRKSVASAEELAANRARAQRLKDKGYTNAKIAEIMCGDPSKESTVRGWLKPREVNNELAAQSIADLLQQNMQDKKYIDVGAGVERELNVSKQRLDAALEIMKSQGYELVNIQVPQATDKSKYTTVKVLAPEGSTVSDVFKNRGDIQSLTDYSLDGGLTFERVKYPKSIDSNRVLIKYDEEGGSDMDGVILLRRGVDDISLGESSYAQVRIAVDGTHYMKGMAMYSDDIPDGYDVIYNTNKHVGTPPEKVFKELKDNPDLPFGAVIKANGQREYIDADGNKQLSVINKLKEEGDWNDYSRTLSSQMLSKQPLKLINRQLDLSYADKQAEYDDIMSVTNPAVKKKLLMDFAEDCDASAVHLKAAALPRQTTKVILPIPSLKDNEIYAPDYKDGESVVLIRYPHGGTFEIPQLKVNNKQADAKEILGNAKDAVGINKNVADRLSGADFDGDTVIVIPVNDRVKVQTSRPLEGLKGFDPKAAYPGYEGMKKMSEKEKGQQMGSVSNLITDMTLQGASTEELARAVRHSMVVIDAAKHGLNWKQSEVDNGIKALKKKYQGRENAGASTLISKASSDMRIPERKRSYTPDKETGEWTYTETGRTYTKTNKLKNGDIREKEVLALTKSTKMAETKDARTLSSGTQQEEAYASYANKLKALANKSRKEAMAVKPTEISAAAKKTYAVEIASLDAKLNNALKNAPRERQAQLEANVKLSEVKRQAKLDDRELSKDDIKKYSNQFLATARVNNGAKRSPIEISDKEWEAIQSGAVSTSKLNSILNYADADRVRQLATPRNSSNNLTAGQISRINAMKAMGTMTTKEIADAVGVSTSTVSSL